MGNKLKKLIMFLVVVLGMTLFANEEQKAPNEIIKDNPEREVTTVESMKVRDHATMSLSVTKKNEKVIEGELNGDRLKVKLPVKGINENTLDRMAKPKEGKRLVVESKSKINPRMAKMATKDIKKMPTQEEMNNLTVEQIQAMMSNTTGEKEEESQSKNIKNHIATENEEGVNLDILGVNKNENIYVNVEENGKVIDRYRVAIMDTPKPKSSTYYIEGERVGRVNNINDNSLWLLNKEKPTMTNRTGNDRFRSATFDYSSTPISTLTFVDNFLGTRKINLSTSPLSQGLTFAIKTTHDNKMAYSPIVDTGTVGNTGQSYDNMNTAPQQGTTYNDYKEAMFYAHKKSDIFKIEASSFRKLYMLEKDTGTTKVNTLYLNGAIIKVGFDYSASVTSSGKRYPGYYQTGFNEKLLGTYNGSYESSSGTFVLFSVTAQNLKMDGGDAQVDHNNPTTEKQFSKTLSTALSNTWYQVNTPAQDDQYSISFMRNLDDNWDGLGLFLIQNNNRTNIKRYIDDNSTPNNYYTINYAQGNVTQQAKIRVSQANGQWAKVEISPIALKAPTDGSNPKVEFIIVQGRQFSGGYAEYRRIKYIVTFPKIVEPKKDINIQLDPRIKNITKNDQAGSYSWITLDKRFGKWDHSDKTLSEGVIYVDGVYQDDAVRVSGVESVEGKGTKNTSDGYDKFKKPDSPRDEIVFKKDVTFTQLSSNSNLMLKPAADTYKITYNGDNNKKYTSTITVTSVAEPSDSWYKSDKGYTGNGIINLSGKDKVGQTYALANPSVSISGNELHLNTHNGFLPIFAGLVKEKTTTEIVTSYKVTINGENGSKTVQFGTTNNGVTTADEVLKVQLVKTNDVGNKKNIKVTKLKDDDFTKNIKFEYYSGVVKLGEYDLTVTNTKTVDPIGTLTTTIDPRLARITEEEWLTLGNFSGGTDLADLTANKYSGLIKATTNQLDPQKTIKGIIKISKGGTNYSYIEGDKNNYKRYGTSNNPLIAILTTKTDGNIADTSALHNNANFARKVKDQGSIDFEFQAGDNYYYSFNHNLVVAGNPSGEPGKFTAEKGYIGDTSVNLSGKEIDKTYTLARSGANTNNYEIDISGATTSGWIPTLHGLFDESKNIASYYKIDSGNAIEFGTQNNGVDITENRTTLFNIKLTRPEDPSNKKNVQIIKRKDIDFTKKVKIEYYHSSGIKLGEFTVNVSNTKTVTPIGSMSNEIDPRLMQKSNEWISLAGYGHGNIGELEENRYLEFIGITNSDISETNKQRTIISINEVKKGSNKYTEISNSADNKDYARYGTSNTPLLGIKKKNNTSTDNNNIGTNISDLTGTNFFARKISDTGEVSVEFVATNKNNYIFTHNLILYAQPNTNEYDQTNNYYIGSGNLNLWTAKLNKEYTLTTGAETDTKLALSNPSGTLPKLTGILPRYNTQVIADKYKVTVTGEGTSVAMKSLGTAFSILGNKVEINLKDTTSDNLVVKKLSDENFNETTVLIEYYHDNGIKLGQYTLKLSNTGSETNYGTLTTKVDPRYVQYDNTNHPNFWISSSGITGPDLSDFSSQPLTGILKTTRDTSTSKNIKEIISVKDGNNNIYSEESGAGEYPHRYKKASDYLVAIKSDKTENIGIESFETNNLIARKYKDNDAGILTINFRAKDDSRGVFYHKFELLSESDKDFTANEGYTGSGTVDFTGKGNNIYTLKKSGAGNNEINVNGNGHLPVINGMIDKTALLATHYKVNSGAEVEITKSTNIENGSYTLSFDTTAFTTKLQKNNDNTVNTPIIIEYLYKKNNKTIKLGSYTLTIKNIKTEDIGTYTLTVDKRLWQNKLGWWILTDGTISNDKNNKPTTPNYLKMFDKSGFTHQIFNNSGSITQDNIWVEGNVISEAGGWLNDKTNRIAFTTEVNKNDILYSLPLGAVNQFQNKLAGNSSNSTYTFIFKVGNTRYKGDVNYIEGNTHTSITGNATLNLTGVSKGTSDTWASKSNGTATFGKMNLVFTNGKTLFDMGSYGGTQITNKFSYKIGTNGSEETVNLNGGSLSKDINLNSSGVADIRVAFVDEGLQITKLSNEIIDGVTVTITPKYNDITLGVLNLTVTNTAETLGNITVEVDRRLAQIKATDWIGANGNLYDNTGVFGNYSNLIKAEDGILNTVDSYKVIDIESINTASNKDLIKADGKRASYKYYDDKNKNILALPYNTTNHTVTLGHYDVDNESLIVVSKKYIESTTRSKRSADLTVTNSFMLTARTTGAQPEDKLYTGSVIEKYVGKESYSGSGNIDLGSSTIDEKYIFGTTVSNKTITSNVSGINITNVEGDPVNSLGKVKDKTGQNIANKIEVDFTVPEGTKESKVATLVSNTLEITRHNLTVGIDTTGGLTLTRKGPSDVTQVVIRYYYDPEGGEIITNKAVTLGTFTLSVTNANPIIPLGTLTTTIDPRLARITDEEWLTLGSYGGRDLLTLTENKYLGLIEPTSDSLTSSKTISKISKVMKNSTEYEALDDVSSNGITYKRYGRGSTPKVAILKSGTSDIIDTNELITNRSLARKINDADGEIHFEFRASDNSNNSFTHKIEVESLPNEKPNKFTAENGYIGSATIDISGIMVDTLYTLVEDEVNGNEINIGTVDGWLPTLHGLFNKNENIASYYKVDSSEPIYFEQQNNGYNIRENNEDIFNIKLIKPESPTNKENIQITKKKDTNFSNKAVLIEYYHLSGIKLGQFTLTVNNTRTEKNLGESTVKIDSRIAQVSDAYSWIDLKNGDMFQLTTGIKAGNYTDFIGIPSAFSNAQNHSGYNEFNLEDVIEINNLTSTSGSLIKDFYTYNGTKYTITKNNDEAGIPTNIKLKDFVKVDSSTKLVISKFDVTKSDHTKNNKFLISGRSENQIVAFKGNIKEVYLDKNEREITGNIDKTQNIFSGSGTLNLAPATIGTSYWFAKTKPTSGTSLPGNGNNSNKVILELDSQQSDPLNAAGIIPKSKNNRVANKMVLTVGGKEETVNLNGENLEKELTIGEGKIKIAIDTSGRLVVTKTQEGNMQSTPIKIDYYYKPNGSTIDKSEIHLGTFDLTVENPVVDSSKDVRVKIDKRFISYNTNYNWLFRDGRAMGDITSTSSSPSDKFSNFFTFDGELNNTEAGTIQWGIGVEGREYYVIGNGNTNYKSFHVKDNSNWKDQAAVPNKGELSNINNLVVVSKGNKDSDPNLNNRFSLLYTATSGNKYKIYRGNLKEEIVGNGKTDGTGTINLNDMEDDVAYEFKKENYNSDESSATGESTSNKSLEMTNVKVQNSATQPLPDGKTAPEIKDAVIANKITVNNNGASSNSNTVIVDGIEFGIGDNGGLTVKKLQNTTFNESKTYTIEFSYISGVSGLNKIVLSNFTLTIVGNEFELDPDDQVLDFGKMFYDSRYGAESYETRVKTFTVKNQNNKNITFNVKANNSKMISTSDPQNEVQLINIGVKKKSNTSFELGATAVLTKDTKPGSYEGTIEVIVDILEKPSNP